MNESVEPGLNAEPSELSRNLDDDGGKISSLLRDKYTHALGGDFTDDVSVNGSEEATSFEREWSKRVETFTDIANATVAAPKHVPRLRFVPERFFSGAIVDSDGEKRHATLVDEKDQRFEYEFNLKEIPPAQRARAEIGAIINVCSGMFWIGNTQMRGVKLYLALDRRPASIKDHMVNETIKTWNF